MSNKKNRATKEIKLMAIQEYREGKGSLLTVAQKYNAGETTLRHWIRQFDTFGALAFEKSGNQAYTREFKIQVIKDYLSGKASQDDLCKKYKIKSTSQLRQWIMKYNNHEKLCSCSGGTEKIMVNGRKTTFEECVDIVRDYLESGSSFEEISRKYEISYQQIYQWVHKFKEDGVDGLRDRRGRKKPEEMLTEADRLRAELKLERAKNRKLEAENLFLKKLEEIERRR